MRHRATRPVIGLLLRLPRATARRLGLAARPPARTRVLGLLAAVRGRGRRGLRRRRLGRGRRCRPAGGVVGRPGAVGDVGARRVRAAGAGDDGLPLRDPEAHRSTRGAVDADALAAGGPLLDERGEPVGCRARLPSIATRTAAPSPREAASTAADDDVPPETTVSHEVTGPGAALLTFSADETRNVRVQPRRCGVRPVRLRRELLRARPGLAHLHRPRHGCSRERRRQPGQHPVALHPRGAEPSGDR